MGVVTWSMARNVAATVQNQAHVEARATRAYSDPVPWTALTLTELASVPPTKPVVDLLIVKCGAVVYHVPRKNACHKSTFIRLATSGTWREAQTCVIDLPGQDAEILQHVIAYLPRGSLDLQAFLAR
jgi:hypothetical protein